MCSNCRYLTLEQISNMSREQLIYAYRQGFALKDKFHSLGPSCISQISIGQAINLNAAPMGGIAPYTVNFYKKLNTSVPVQIGAAQINVPEAINSTTPSTTTISYTITDADSISATGDSGELPPLLAGYIRIITQITDSCPLSSGGPKICSELCDINITCPLPTCNIIVEPA